MPIKQLTAVALTALVLHACSPPPTTIDGAEAAELAGWMTGTFSSREQALADPDNYFEVRLVMAPIWTERDDGPWPQRRALGGVVLHVHRRSTGPAP